MMHGQTKFKFYAVNTTTHGDRVTRSA